MLFNSLIFLIFCAVFFLLWQWAKHAQNRRWIAITVASFVFYGWWDWRFLFLIVFSGLIDFYAGLAMEKHPARKKLLLTLSLLGNLGTLAAFKYMGFITENLNQLAGWLNMGEVPIVTLPLVVGISFYTFQSMSYTIDIYKGQLQPTKSLPHFFAYLSMFPQLVAGPIIRASELLPQIETHTEPTEEERFEGMRLIIHGYFKKVVIADNLAPVINSAFGASELDPSGTYWWIIMTMFAFQIYCDFSGYSDIARGLARWMGYYFPLNFNHPYISTSFQEFWTRWHISLSTWFRDYVYIPLGGAKKSTGEKSIGLGLQNMWVTMLISGLWHGASWNFFIWGALHSAYLSVERLTHWPQRLSRLPLGNIIVSLLILIQVWVAWVFFRAETLPKAVEVSSIMFTINSFTLASVYAFSKYKLGLLGIAVLREIYFAFHLEKSRVFTAPIFVKSEPLILALMSVACVYLRGTGSAFIYFQF